MIGENVRRRREELGLTGVQLAERAGMAPSAISQIETGRRSPSSTSVIKLADALGVEAGELFPKGQLPLPLDLEQRRETARRLMDAGVSEATSRGVSGMDHRSEEYWRALARVSGLESGSETVRPASILADVLVASAKTLADTDVPKSVAEFGRIKGMVSLIDAVRTPLLEFVVEAMARGAEAASEDVEEIAEVAAQLTEVSTHLTERSTTYLKESNENLRQINEYLKRQIEEATNAQEQREAEEMSEQMRQLTERISA
jgi:transcriptional regulator with XRE-family HTH domain